MKKLGFILILLIGQLFHIQVQADLIESPEVKSEAAVLLDSQSGAILYSKNQNDRMFPASLTKIATAIYAIENGNLEDLVTISEEEMEVGGTRVYITSGEKLPLLMLIQGMLINSGNDAALAIAMHMDGSLENFSKNINKYLKEEIGVENTSLKNPHGLFDENHYTTAYDLGKITSYALKNETFREIFGTKQMDWKVKSWESTLYTHHRLLKGEFPYEGITGGKTGYVPESKLTLATSADNGDIKLIAIALKAARQSDIYQDTMNLFDYGFANFKSSKLTESTIFKNDNSSFNPKEDTFVTEPLMNSIKEVNKKGVLSIKDETGAVIQSIQLEPKNTPVVPTKEKKTSQEEDGILKGALYYGLLIILALALIRKIRKRFLNY